MGHTRGDRGVAVCPWCWYARDRDDICGVYCTGGFTNEDGKCEHFLDYEEGRERRSHMAFKTNVVKATWQVETLSADGRHKNILLVSAESEEKARLMAPEGETVVSVTKLDGGEDPA